MDVNRPEAAKQTRTFDSAYSFSFSIAVGLVLFIGGLVISGTRPAPDHDARSLSSQRDQRRLPILRCSNHNF